jgi:hypothetical protein
MATRWLVALLGFVVLHASWVQASDPVVERGQISTGAAVSAAVLTVPSPWIHAQTQPGVRARIQSAFAIAVARVRDNAECGALFSRLGRDGVEMLRTTLYFQVPHSFDGISICERGDAATFVGSPSTFVCRHFQRLGDEQAAVVLIHEALHHAGLTEYPQDPEAMTSARITRMVEKNCGP